MPSTSFSIASFGVGEDRFVFNAPSPKGTDILPDELYAAVADTGPLSETPASPSLDEQVTFLSGVDANGKVAGTSFWTWDGKNPPVYSTTTGATGKWGSPTAGTAGGTLTVYFDPASTFSASDQRVIMDGFDLWAAVANVKFAVTTDASAAQITIKREAMEQGHIGNGGSAMTSMAQVGSSTLATYNSGSLKLNSSLVLASTVGATSTTYPSNSIVHEIGHVLGLGHPGAYNGAAMPATDQYSAYDVQAWSTMSYLGIIKTLKYGAVGFDANTEQWFGSPQTPMPVDILAIQRLYGAPADTPLSGGQVFGFHCNITGTVGQYYDFTLNNTLVNVTIWDAGTNNTLDLSGFSSKDTVNLNPGTLSSCHGTKNIAIAFGTQINTLVCGSGGTTVTCNDFGDTVRAASGNNTVVGGSGNDTLSVGTGSDTLSGGAGTDVLTGGAGNDTLDGGANVDTAMFSGNKSAYTITQTSTGNFTITGTDGSDTLANIEYAKFDDQTMRLLPGTGTTVNFAADPSTYMGAIRDFDGNDLGGSASWKLIGTADVNGDGRAEHILFNREIGRWAEVGAEEDGKTYFANNGWAGDTRVVGIYIDPLVADGTVVKDSDFDSQRRFQNDLRIDNIHGILGQADYDHNGLQEVYFSLTDGTAYLHAYMHADGNIQYANYQNQAQVMDYLTRNGFSSSTWAGWFAAS